MELYKSLEYVFNRIVDADGCHLGEIIYKPDETKIIWTDQFK